MRTREQLLERCEMLRIECASLSGEVAEHAVPEKNGEEPPANLAAVDLRYAFHWLREAVKSLSRMSA